ncbi:MAG: indolepyruvate ferredoxin oxidoreductase subunit alpha [delta proteobacterium ML8_F1]|nr:MAG: indolepyruvate ferredoxin oxidoreductase subunit alpha [delta proteobacterium ML8_F1]
MKKLLTGNEAIARGAYEGGIVYASAYPGTPSTEILENIALYKEDIIAEWAPNEKVALEAVIGASIAGGRAIASMKHVGVNVAADPLFTFAYTGVTGGTVLVTADEPGMHSSQNEQDNRYYARFSKIPMLEPSNSQEAKDMVVEAIRISETYDSLVLLRVTTRICHSKSLVNLGDRVEGEKKPYTKQLDKFDAVPSTARKLHAKVEKRLTALEAFSNETPLNFIEWHDKKIGVIASGISYEYAKEVFGDRASYLKLGFTHPLPFKKIEDFAREVETLYVIEELEPYIEEQIKSRGIHCIGKERLSNQGELSPEIIRSAFLEEKLEVIDYDASDMVPRPPTLCAGCPHRGFYYELGKRKNIMINGDIGCYGLSGFEPLNAKDTTICMGASVSMAHGAQTIFNRYNEDMRAVATIGDSTFFHTGMNSLLDVIYNRSNTITCILDNRITGMTGHQDHPGTGYTLQGMPTTIVEIEDVVKAMGVKHVRVINPHHLDEVNEALDWALAIDNEPSVIITRYPCALKKYSPQDLEEFGAIDSQCVVDESTCIGCKKCLKTGCPALIWHPEKRRVSIDTNQCVGCQVCLQTCPVNAISVKGVAR